MQKQNKKFECIEMKQRDKLLKNSLNANKKKINHLNKIIHKKYIEYFSLNDLSEKHQILIKSYFYSNFPNLFNVVLLNKTIIFLFNGTVKEGELIEKFTSCLLDLDMDIYEYRTKISYINNFKKTRIEIELIDFDN